MLFAGGTLKRRWLGGEGAGPGANLAIGFSS
jgi:hypothetical protein